MVACGVIMACSATLEENPVCRPKVQTTCPHPRRRLLNKFFLFLTSFPAFVIHIRNPN